MALFMAALSTPLPLWADAISDFYGGQEMRLLIGYRAGAATMLMRALRSPSSWFYAL
jgi:hypothetical protein